MAGWRLIAGGWNRADTFQIVDNEGNIETVDSAGVVSVAAASAADGQRAYSLEIVHQEDNIDTVAGAIAIAIAARIAVAKAGADIDTAGGGLPIEQDVAAGIGEVGESNKDRQDGIALGIDESSQTQCKQQAITGRQVDIALSAGKIGDTDQADFAGIGADDIEEKLPVTEPSTGRIGDNDILGWKPDPVVVGRGDMDFKTTDGAGVVHINRDGDFLQLARRRGSGSEVNLSRRGAVALA